MKKVLLAAALVGIMLIGGVTGAQAFWVGSVYNPNVGYVPNVLNFDWSSSGSGLAVGLGEPLGGGVYVGREFDFLFQANLGGVTDPDGNPVTDFNDNGLNVDFEYTLVAKFPEKVTKVIDLGRW